MTAGMGEMGALGAALTWGVSNQVNSAVARRVGSNSLALIRIPFMMLFCGLLCLFLQVDTTISGRAVFLLTLSGLLGVAVGDLFLYRAILIIGPTMTLLVVSLSSGITAIIGRLFLGEILPAQGVVGICVSLLGVAVVVGEHSGSILLPGQAVPQGKTLVFGVTLAAAGAFCLAGGYISQRLAMQTGVEPLWASLVRVSCAGVLLWGVGLFLGWSQRAARNLVEQRPVRWLMLFSGSIAGLGMWCASIGLAYAPAGVAATLIGLQPIIVAIVGAVWYRKKPTIRVVVGALTAFAGTALICLR